MGPGFNVTSLVIPTCDVIFYALKHCFQAMAMLGHYDFIIWHEREVANDI